MKTPAPARPTSSENQFSKTAFDILAAHDPATLADPEETLIADTRADLRPAQMVEQKLLSLLKGKALCVSHMQMANLVRNRN